MKPSLRRPLLLLSACLASAALAACAAWSDVREVASGVPQAAYELRGAKLSTLQAEALRLCPGGYQITRSWQRYGQASDTWWSRWMNQATDYNGVGDRQAFMAIVCKDGDAPVAAHAAAASAPAAPVESTPALVPVPVAVPMPTSSPPPVPVPNAPPETAPASAPASAAAAKPARRATGASAASAAH